MRLHRELSAEKILKDLDHSLNCDHVFLGSDRRPNVHHRQNPSRFYKHFCPVLMYTVYNRKLKSSNSYFVRNVEKMLGMISVI